MIPGERYFLCLMEFSKSNDDWSKYPLGVIDHFIFEMNYDSTLVLVAPCRNREGHSSLPSPRTTMSGPRQRRGSDRGVRSRVSIAREVNIGVNEVAPRGDFPSLDFDRIVNAYSIEALKKRLFIHHQLFAPKDKKAQGDYRTFQENRESERLSGILDDEKSTTLQMPYGKTVMTWALTLLTGLICALVAILILYCVEHIVLVRSHILSRHLERISAGMDDEASTQPVQVWGVFGQLVMFNMLLALLSAAMCVFWAPNAIGSGIPEVKAYLNGVRVPSFADMKTFLTKIFGTILSVSSGLVVGPEGPLVHIGAIIGQGLTKTTRLDIALRDFQRGHPTLSGWLGCAKTDAFGEKKARESLFIEFSRRRKRSCRFSGTTVWCSFWKCWWKYDEDEDTCGPLPVLGGNSKRSSGKLDFPVLPGGLTRSHGMGELPPVSDSQFPRLSTLLVTRGSLFVNSPPPLPVPTGTPDPAKSSDESAGSVSVHG